MNEEAITELLNRLKALELEKIELREAEKELFEEYSDRLNTKALKIAVRIAKMRAKLLSEDDNAVDQILLVIEDKG